MRATVAVVAMCVFTALAGLVDESCSTGLLKQRVAAKSDAALIAEADRQIAQLERQLAGMKETKRVVPASLVEVAKAGDGVQHTAGAEKSTTLANSMGYHQEKREEKSFQQAPLPPPRFAAVGAHMKKAVPVPGGPSPYSMNSAYGRGPQDANTPFTGSYAGSYSMGSGGPMGTSGYGSFPMYTDPRGFGGSSNFSTPYSTWFGPLTGKGISSTGFQYQVPYSPVHPSTPFTGNPFQALGAQGPYYAPYGHGGSADPANPSNPFSMVTNYTQFGPRPFGPYGQLPGAQPGMPGVGSPMSSAGGLQGPGARVPTSIPVTHPLQSIQQFRSAMAGGGLGMGGGMGMVPGGGVAGMPQNALAAGMSAQWNPAFGMGLIPHLNAGNAFNPAFPAASHDPMNGRMGTASIWASQMPGVHPMYNPSMAMHHGLNLPGGAGQFKDPSLSAGLGQGYPHPDFDRYSSVFESIPAPGGSEAAGGAAAF